MGKSNIIDNCNEMEKSFPIRLLKYMQQYIVGQKTYLEKLSMKIYRLYKLGLREKPFMVIGNTGSGKTYAIEVLRNCKQLLPKSKFTVIIYDATALTPNGFEGDSCKNIAIKFKKQAMKDSNIENCGLIYIDEADKLFAASHSSEGDNISAIVQHQLMNFISGATILEGLDTSRILFVLGGAFQELYEYEKAKKKTIGFNLNDDTGNSIIETSRLRDNMLMCGVQREFLGRIDSIVKIEKLTEIELKCILLHPQHGLIAKKRKEYRMMGLDFELSQELIQKTIEIALDEDLGARSLSSVLENIMKNFDFYMLEQGKNYMYLDVGVLDGELPQFYPSREDFIDGQRHFVASAQK